MSSPSKGQNEGLEGGVLRDSRNRTPSSHRMRTLPDSFCFSLEDYLSTTEASLLLVGQWRHRDISRHLEPPWWRGTRSRTIHGNLAAIILWLNTPGTWAGRGRQEESLGCGGWRWQRGDNSDLTSYTYWLFTHQWQTWKYFLQHPFAKMLHLCNAMLCLFLPVQFDLIMMLTVPGLSGMWASLRRSVT